jgi:hypothetical protein
VVTEAFWRRWRFFQGRTGCVGREATAAFELAKAELWRQVEEDAGRLRVRWLWDEQGKQEWWCQCGCRPNEVLACIVETRSVEDADACPHGSIDWCECDSWQPAASLGGIGDPDPSDRRLVEAELCAGVAAEGHA